MQANERGITTANVSHHPTCHAASLRTPILVGSGSTSSIVTTQVVWYVLCRFNAGDVVTTLIALVTTAGVGTAPTGIYSVSTPPPTWRLL
jgi:hypothetical protein